MRVVTDFARGQGWLGRGVQKARFFKVRILLVKVGVVEYETYLISPEERRQLGKLIRKTDSTNQQLNNDEHLNVSLLGNLSKRY